MRVITDLMLEDYVSSYDPLVEDWEAFSLDGINLDGQTIEGSDVYLVVTKAYLDEYHRLCMYYLILSRSN